MPGDAVRRYVDLQPGDPAPWFVQRSTSAERYHFDTAAGRWIVMCFLATAGDAAGREDDLVEAVRVEREHFDPIEYAEALQVRPERPAHARTAHVVEARVKGNAPAAELLE